VCLFVSMSNDSIPHWPMHDGPFVVWWLTVLPPSRKGIIFGSSELRRIRKCPTHPNNDQVPTKERKDITLIRPYNLDWDTTNLLFRVTGPHSRFVQLCHTVQPNKCRRLCQHRFGGLGAQMWLGSLPIGRGKRIRKGTNIVYRTGRRRIPTYAE
jgi:hypothetical protein